MWSVLLFAVPASADEAAGPDISPALEVPKKGAWDPKGKAITLYGSGDAKRKQGAHAEGITLLLQSLDAQPGCGKCLSALSGALTDAKRYEDAAKVGMVMVQLFPDRADGWRRVSDAWSAALDSRQCVDATTKLLAFPTEKSTTAWWSRRNKCAIQGAMYDEAGQLLDTAEAAGVKKEDVACLRIQIAAAKGEAAAGRELWATCSETADAELERETEGWLALAEGDSELAAKRLTMAGADDTARLAIALVRLEQRNFEGALNLANKILEERDWALDGQLAKAEALAGLGRTDDALAVLEEDLLAEGWADVHKSMSLDHVLLKQRGTAWPKEVAVRAEALGIQLHVAKGDQAGAQAIHDQAVAVSGEDERLKAALQPPAAPAPAAPAPAPK